MMVLFVDGLPAPKGSRITGVRKDGKLYSRPAHKGEKMFGELVATSCLQHKTLTPPYTITLKFHLPKPQKPSYGWPVRGDIDKLARCVLDGLVRGDLLVDDRHVTALNVVKMFATGGRTGCEIIIN